MRREREAKLTVVSWLSDIAVEVCEESEQRDDRAPWKKHFNIHWWEYNYVYLSDLASFSTLVQRSNQSN